MADTKLDDLTALTTPSGDDILYIVDDPAGTPLDRKIALNNLFTRGTITASAPVLDASQTWNNGAVTFTGLKFNATDTASAAASLLINLQVGGASRFSVSKTGILTTASAISASGNYIGVFSNVGEYLLGVSSDLRLGRRGAANLRLGSADAAAPVAQTLSVQSGTAGASATTVSISGTALTIAGTITGTIAIGHAVTGTGVTAGTLITAGSGSSWTVNNSQTVGPITAYFNSVGQNLTITGSQGSGPSAGGSIIFQVAPAGSAATTAQNALSTALTIDSNRKLTVADGSVTAPSFGFSSNSATSGFYRTGTNGFGWSVNNNPWFNVRQEDVAISRNGVPLIFGANLDLQIHRDDANILAQRNANNGQTFNLYGRYTSGTDHERFFVTAPTTAGAAVQLGTQKGSGGGTARALEFQTDGTTRMTIGSGGSFTLADAQDIAIGTTTGTKIGTATTQKLGFYNATPVVQPTAVANATDAATVITQLNALLTRMRNLGLIAT